MTEQRTHFPRSGKIMLHLLRPGGIALGLILLLALLHLLTVGLPEGIVRRITAQAQQAGLPVQIESIRLSPLRGWVLKNIRLYSTSPDDLNPLLQAGRLYVRGLPADWLHPVRGGLDVALYGRELSISLGRSWDAVLPEDHPFRTAEQLKAALMLRPDRVEIEHAEAVWGGIRVQAAGTAELTGGGTLQGALPSEEARRKAAELVRTLETFEFGSAPQADLRFCLNGPASAAPRLTGILHAGKLSRNGREYDGISVNLLLRDRVLDLEELRIEQPDGTRMTVSGTLDPDARTARLTADSTLCAEDLLGLLPARIRADFAAWKITPFGPLAFRLTCGPAPPESLFQQVRGEVRDARLRRNGLILDPVSFRAAWDGSRLEVREIQTSANGGVLCGEFQFQPGSGAWSAEIDSRCHLALVRSVAQGALAEFIGRFAFTNETPKFSVSLSQAKRGAPLHLAGELSANRFVCSGIPLDHLQTAMVYSNRTLSLDPLHISGGEREFSGNVQIDFPGRQAAFEAVTSFDPLTISRVLAPQRSTVLEKFRFDGPVYARGRGRIDYGAGTNQAFRCTLHAERAGIGPFQVDAFDTLLEGRGSQLLFTNTTFRMCGGTGEGSAGFDLVVRDGRAPYRMDAALTQIDFSDLLQQAGAGRERARGQLSAAVHITADAADGFWNSARGGGSVDIEKGQLADLPLLGGFTRLIQSSFPMFSLFSISGFFADYEFRDGALWSENVELKGTLLSARARGNYSPAGGLDFVLQASPLKPPAADKKWYQLDQQAAAAVRWATSPLFKFFEFQLEGPLNEPAWRFVNLPEELSNLLQRGSGNKPADGDRP